jgi:cytochrome P450
MTQEPQPQDDTNPVPKAPDAYQPIDIEFLKDPHATLRQMREEGRIHRTQGGFAGFGLEGYVVTRYDDVNEVLRDRAHISDFRKLPEGDPRRRRIDALGDSLPPSILTLDPPEHDRIRGLVNKAFTPRAIEALKPRITEIANELLDAVEGETEIEFMETMATPLPVIVIAELLGVPSEDRDRFKEWSNAVVAISPSDITDAESLQKRFQQAQAASSALAGYFREQVELRRDEPGDDLISKLIEVEEQGDRLTEPEMISLCRLLLNAGNLTTTDLLGNGLLELLRHPDQMQLLRDDPDLVPSAVEEMLRYTPPVSNTGRLTANDTEVAGCPVPGHANVAVSLMAANRDPKVFDHPESFDVTREENRHLSFGGGIHYCLGAPLARAEAQGALRALLERYNRIETAVPLDEVEWRGGGAFRGLRALPLRVS